MVEGIPKTSKHIKRIIEKLKEGPIYQSNLEKDLNLIDEKNNFPLERAKISHSQTDRILNNYLKYWGFVERSQEGRKIRWAWKDVPHFENEAEYKVLLQHSKNMIPGIDSLCSGVSLERSSAKYLDPELKTQYLERIEKGKKYADLVKRHLETGYEDTFLALKNFEKLAELNSISGKNDLEFFQIKMKEFAESHPEKTIEKTLKSIRKSLGITTKGDQERRNQFEKHYDSYLKERSNLFGKTESESIWLESELRENIIKNLLFLRRKIEEGEPLSGFCSLCPNIRIGPKKIQK